MGEHPLLVGRRLYLCTPDRPDLAGFVAACVRGGVDLVQLREKRLEARPLLARAVVVAAVCRDLGV
ncbi:MAG: thiamine phosphate synthase, partial [Acidimicrobiales bacterium]